MNMQKIRTGGIHMLHKCMYLYILFSSALAHVHFSAYSCALAKTAANINAAHLNGNTESTYFSQLSDQNLFLQHCHPIRIAAAIE